VLLPHVCAGLFELVPASLFKVRKEVKMCGRFDLDAGLPEVRWITKGFGGNFKTGEVFPTNSALVLIEQEGQIKTDSMI
jgi:hypothetical protein